MADEIHLEIAPPDIASHRAGNRGIPYVTTFDSELPGPHAVMMALIHGNEICGAVALDHLFRAGGIRPARGRITLAFGNVEAYRRFDRRKPAASRYVDEDLNRVWAPSALDGHRANTELARARQLRPVIDSADFLLDLHSMNDGRTPLLLAGLTEKTLAFARPCGARRRASSPSIRREEAACGRHSSNGGRAGNPRCRSPGGAGVRGPARCWRGDRRARTAPRPGSDPRRHSATQLACAGRSGDRPRHCRRRG